jgi:ribonucleotide reductase alpha subunit
MLGLDYAAPAARSAAAEAMRTICEAAYLASIELARERGTRVRWSHVIAAHHTLSKLESAS